MRFANKHGQLQFFNQYVIDLLDDCQVFFLDSQINGTVFIIQRLWKVVLVYPDFAQDQNFLDVIGSLRSVWTYSGFIVNTMDLEKTFLALLFMAMQDQFMSLNLVLKQNRYKPILCIVPSRIMLHQWKKRIEKFLIPTLIVTHGIRQFNMKSNWVLATAMKNALNKLDQ